MFAEFERESHFMAERGEALTAESLNAVYAKLNAEYYPSVERDELIAFEWMRVPHFYNAFYVYKYATGFSADARVYWSNPYYRARDAFATLRAWWDVKIWRPLPVLGDPIDIGL